MVQIRQNKRTPVKNWLKKARNIALGAAALTGLGASGHAGGAAVMGPDSCEWNETDGGGTCTYEYSYYGEGGGPTSSVTFHCQDGDAGQSYYGYDIWDDLNISSCDCKGSNCAWT